MIGWTLTPFGRSDRFYPIEALMVWLVISFDSILAYELIKGVTHDLRFAKNAVFGPPAGAVASLPL